MMYRKSRLMVVALRAAILPALLCVAGIFGPATASVFDDDEARRAILELRAKVDANQTDLNSRLDKLDAATRGQLDLANQIEMLRQDVARLRGQVEALTNDLSNQQKRAKDYYGDLDARLRKLEPQQITVDGKPASVGTGETRAYEAAVAQFKNSDFKGATASFGNFLTLYPDSAYAPAAQYWIGISYYAQRDYKSAIAAQQSLAKTWPESPRAADALLNIASSQIDMADKKTARKTLEALLAKYPDSDAAATARDRLAKLK
jgi:tol-pal system protein YbgF